MQKYVKINASSIGDNIILAAPGEGKKIKVLHYLVITDTDVAVTWKSNTTELSGPLSLVANGGATTTVAFTNVAGYGMLGLLDCNENEPLVLNLSGAAIVGGHALVYIY